MPRFRLNGKRLLSRSAFLGTACVTGFLVNRWWYVRNSEAPGHLLKVSHCYYVGLPAWQAFLLQSDPRLNLQILNSAFTNGGGGSGGGISEEELDDGDDDDEDIPGEPQSVNDNDDQISFTNLPFVLKNLPLLKFRLEFLNSMESQNAEEFVLKTRLVNWDWHFEMRHLERKLSEKSSDSKQENKREEELSLERKNTPKKGDHPFKSTEETADKEDCAQESCELLIRSLSKAESLDSWRDALDFPIKLKFKIVPDNAVSKTLLRPFSDNFDVDFLYMHKLYNQAYARLKKAPPQYLDIEQKWRTVDLAANEIDCVLLEKEADEFVSREMGEEVIPSGLEIRPREIEAGASGRDHGPLRSSEQLQENNINWKFCYRVKSRQTAGPFRVLEHTAIIVREADDIHSGGAQRYEKSSRGVDFSEPYCRVEESVVFSVAGEPFLNYLAAPLVKLFLERKFLFFRGEYDAEKVCCNKGPLKVEVV